MNVRIFSLVLVAAMLAMGMGSMGAVAQENATGEQEPDAGTVVNVTQSETRADTLARQEKITLSRDTEIVGWEFSDDKLILAVETGYTTNVDVVDNLYGIDREGSTQIPVVTQRVDPAENASIIEMPVEDFDGDHSVTVSAGGEPVRLSTGLDEQGDDPLRHFGGQSGLFSGMGLAIVSALTATGFVLWREDSGVTRA